MVTFVITIALVSLAFGVVMAVLHFRSLEKERKDTINKINGDRDKHFINQIRRTKI